MKFNEKNAISQKGFDQLYGIDFHDFITLERNSNMVELASEFGLQVKDVKILKRRLGRS
ncbi:MAG: hypothetical protein ACI4XL_05185 [Bacillus sp. (in: firmicutes)]